MTLHPDIRQAIRSLRRSPGFTALAVLALAFGIAVNNTFFTVIDVAALRGLPLKSPERLVDVSTRDAANRAGAMSFADFIDLRATSRRVTTMAAATQRQVALGETNRAPERVTAAYVSADGLRILGNTMQLGREFSAADDRPGAPLVGILAADVWRDRYGSDAGVIGRTIRVDGTEATIVGVMPDAFIYTTTAGIWLPLAGLPDLANQPRSARTLSVFGALAPGTSVAQASDELARLARALAEAHPDTNTGIRAEAVPLNDKFTQRIAGSVWPTFIAAGLIVLLIACANVANLLLARGLQRLGEMAIRSSLGASRWRIVRQLLLESTMLASAGGLLGVGLSFIGLRSLQAMIPRGTVPYWFDFRMSAGVLGALTLVCAGTVLVFGLVPAWQTSRIDTRPLLAEQGRGIADTRRSRRFTTVFLSIQLGLAFILVALTALSIRVERVRERLDTPIETTSVMTTVMTLPPASYATAGSRTAFYERLLRETASQPNVTAASLASVLPYGGAAVRRLQIEGRPAAGDNGPRVPTVVVSPKYFATMGVGLLRGRDFVAIDSASENATGRGEAIVNDRFARTFFPGQDPIGRRIQLDAAGPNAPSATEWLTIVGVSPVVLRQLGGWEPEPIVYLPFSSLAPATAILMVRGTEAAALPPAALQELVGAVDPELPTYRTMPLDRAVREVRWNARASNVIVIAITVISAVLALIGLYAVTAHAVTQQLREFGVRVAFGARPRDIAWLVLRRVSIHLLFGSVAGILFTFGWGRFFSNPEGFGMRLSDPITLSITAGAILAIGIVTCLSPAWHAGRVDPVEHLR